MNHLRRFSLIAALVFLVSPLTAQAAPITFLQFTQAGLGNNFTVASNGVTSTITSSQQVSVIFDPSVCLVPGCGGVTNGLYDFTLVANSTTTASSDGDDIFQNYSGTITITDGAVNLLTVNFSDLFTGPEGGTTATLSSSQPPDTFTGTSTVIDPLKLGTPRGFSISLSSFQCAGGGGLAIVGSSICSGTAAGTGTFSADVEPLVTPEPGTLALFGIGLLGAARKVRRYTTN